MPSRCAEGQNSNSCNYSNHTRATYHLIQHGTHTAPTPTSPPATTASPDKGNCKNRFLPQTTKTPANYQNPPNSAKHLRQPLRPEPAPPPTTTTPQPHQGQEAQHQQKLKPLTTASTATASTTTVASTAAAAATAAARQKSNYVG